MIWKPTEARGGVSPSCSTSKEVERGATANSCVLFPRTPRCGRGSRPVGHPAANRRASPGDGAPRNSDRPRQPCPVGREGGMCGGRRFPAGAPGSFVPTRYADHLAKACKAGDDTSFWHYWELCVVLGLRDGLRSRDAYVPGSRRYAGPGDLFVHARPVEARSRPTTAEWAASRPGLAVAASRFTWRANPVVPGGRRHSLRSSCYAPTCRLGRRSRCGSHRSSGCTRPATIPRV